MQSARQSIFLVIGILRERGPAAVLSEKLVGFSLLRPCLGGERHGCSAD
jgi:hypothetical protein